MVWSQEDSVKMDSAAATAQNELMLGSDGTQPEFFTATALDLVHWWNRWYMKAGHKRLGRILVEVARAERKVNKHQGLAVEVP